MPQGVGADLSLPVNRDIARGLRHPLHRQLLAKADYRLLHPFFAAPLRPGETLAGLSLVGETWVRSILNLSARPMISGQIGYWIVPLSALHPFFVGLYTGDARDVMERSADANAPGGTSARIVGGPNSGQGHLTPGLQSYARRWAGEIGGTDISDNPIPGGEYAPYVSFATWKVAQDWYDMSLPGNTAYENADLFDNPPGLAPYIRGALKRGFDTQGVEVDPNVSTETSYAELLEHLFLLSKSERTYADALAAHGVNPMMAAGVARPVAKMDFNFGPMNANPMWVGVPQGVGFNADPTTVDQTVASTAYDNTATNEAGGLGYTIASERSAFGMVGSDVSFNQGTRQFITEPSILLGTAAFWFQNGATNRYGHHFDMTRMIQPGHWGDISMGGIDEEDFLAVQDIYNWLGTAVQVGEHEDQAGADHVFNLLNLYLHGEETAVSGDVDGALEFRFRGPTGLAIDQENRKISGHLSTQIHVLSDLVAGDS